MLECHLDTFEGVEMISRYNLFYRLISDELSEDKAQIFAEPIKDLDHNQVNWYSGLNGEIRSYNGLSDHDKRYAKDIIAERAMDLDALSKRFLASNSRDRRLAGELLAKILERPSQLAIFLVGDRPVVAGWGVISSRQDTLADETTISNILREKLAEKAAPPPEPEPVPAPPSPAPLKEPVPPPPPPEVIPPKKGWPYFWPVTLTTLALLLAALIWIFWWTEAPMLIPLDPEPIPEVVEKRELVIPEEAAKSGDFSFLEGCWVSTSESLVNSDTGLPIMVKYCFDKSGQGAVTLDETDANGVFTQSCVGQADTVYKDGALIIAEKIEKTCPGNRTYELAILTCKPSDKDGDGLRKVSCVIFQDSIGEDVETDFHRL
jgi:hypothetical protein